MNPIKIISYNVNGIRSALSKGWLDWLAQENPDIICLQEVKAEASQVDLSALDTMGYQYRYWCSAEKKGYSGVAIFSKLAPTDVIYGMGISQYDAEGRMVRLSFPEFTLINLYAPSGSSGEERQDVKFAWMNDFLPFIQQLNQEKGDLVMCGDFNIAHTEKTSITRSATKNHRVFCPRSGNGFPVCWIAGLSMLTGTCIQPNKAILGGHIGSTPVKKTWAGGSTTFCCHRHLPHAPPLARCCPRPNTPIIAP